MLIKKQQNITIACILAILCLCIGAYLIITTAVVSKDSTTFIECAQKIQTKPAETILQMDQHPLYPVVILAVHKIITLFSRNETIFSWIYTAQSISLFLRVCTVAVLYFVGRILVGEKHSFAAVLILIFLPMPAKYGSDALSDWPYLCFLVIGLWLILYNLNAKKIWPIVATSLCAVVDYFIRPEGTQLILYAVLAVIFGMPIKKIATAVCLLLLIFGVSTLPYMIYKKAVFPKQKHTITTAVYNISHSNNEVNEKTFNDKGQLFVINTVKILLLNIPQAIIKFAENICKTFMWILVPPWLIGMYIFFKNCHRHPSYKIIAAFIIINITAMIWLFCVKGYMSERHTMPLAAVTTLYLPAGLRTISAETIKLLKKERNKKSLSFVYKMSVAVAILICLSKLFTPLHADKIYIRKAADWLASHTKTSDIIAVPDLRISFYASRKGEDYKHHRVTKKTDYTVEILSNEELSAISSKNTCQILYTDNLNDQKKIIIYKNTD